MNVVVRGLMAAGTGIYAAIHGRQAFAPPPDTPLWTTLAFGVTALAAAIIAVMLIVTSVRAEVRWERLAAALAAASAVALLASYTVGFFGVSETDLRAETAVVAVAELAVLVAFAIGRLGAFTRGTDGREDLDDRVSGTSSG